MMATVVPLTLAMVPQAMVAQAMVVTRVALQDSPPLSVYSQDHLPVKILRSLVALTASSVKVDLASLEEEAREVMATTLATTLATARSLLMAST